MQVDGGSGDLFVASRESGDILKVAADSEEKSAFEVFVNTGGVPNGVAFDPNGVVYICDFAHQAVLTLGSAAFGVFPTWRVLAGVYKTRGFYGFLFVWGLMVG